MLLSIGNVKPTVMMMMMMKQWTFLCV